MSNTHRAFRPLLALLAAILVCGACNRSELAPVSTLEPALEPSATVARPAPAKEQPAAESDTPAGRVVPGQRSITSFRPEADTVAVALDQLDFKAIFEELGSDATLWYQHVQTLANPYFEGRVNGSAGTIRARTYMEFYFRKYGLEPYFPGTETSLGGAADAVMMSYRQPFDFQTRGRVQVSVSDAHAAIGATPLTEDEDFVVLGNSGSGDVSGPISFVGYGIDDGPDGYSSFDDDTSLEGRIALLLRYEPLDEQGYSQWSDERFSPQAGVSRKMQAVIERGAGGIILVNPPSCVNGRTGLEPIDRSARFGRPLAVPLIQMSHAGAARLLDAADPAGGDLMSWRRKADTGSVTTVDLDDEVEVRLGAETERSRDRDALAAENVGAALPGRGALADEWLVIGGHYDHNGYGQFGTHPEDGPLFPGADDNASGVAGVLVLAKRLSEWYAKTEEADLRSVMFVAFDAEERGLHGSRHFADDPPIPMDSITCLLNMDMIGRLRSGNLAVLGTGTAEGLEELLRRHFESSGLTVNATPAGSGRSDDANFHRASVPAMHFFTGMHSEYTTPQDHAYTVNPVGAAKIIALLASIATDLVSRPEKLEYRIPGNRGRSLDRAPDASRDRGYAPVRLGIRPGMGADLATGILVEAVSPGTSAADGGMQDGDVMLRWNDAELDGMGTLMEHLRAHKPGDVVKIGVRRGAEELVLDVRLKASDGGS